MKKNLLFYTCHRHLNELEYSSLFFNDSALLKEQFEVFIHFNNPYILNQDIFNKIKFNAKCNFLVTSKNNGFKSGHIEATSDLFEMFDQYNMVIHLHPDCYITDDALIKILLEKQFDVGAAPCLFGRPSYCTDFFSFKTKKNFLKEWNKEWSKNPDYLPEHFLHDALHKHNTNLSIFEINRYPDLNACGFREIDQAGLWHEHDNSRVLSYIESNILNKKI